MKAPTTVEKLFRSRGIADIDRHFAALVAELAKCPDDGIPLAAALASALTREGHTCVDLEELAGSTWPDEDGIVLPDRESWLAALETSPVVRTADSKEPAPLVLAGRKRLYLERLHELEKEAAARIRGLCGHCEPLPDGIDGLLERHFPDTSPDGLPRAAARAALNGRFCCISGGPGTGKTTIVAKILSLFLDAGLVSVNGIALAAPTGKAAARLQQAVRGALKTPDASAFAVTTIHRWLFESRRHPGSTDLLIVDEASMVDITIMNRVLETLPGHARLIMLGDSSQLASVQPGSVFADLCAAARVRESPLHSRVVELRHNWRFSKTGGVGRLAEAIRKDDAGAVIDALHDPHDDEISLRPLPQTGSIDKLAEELTERHYEPLVRGIPSVPAEGFDPFRHFRVLCGHRRGPFGSTRFNSLVEQQLKDKGLTGSRDGFYVGRPIIVTRNDPRLGLSNGDTGIVFPGAPGERRVLFPDLRDNKGMALVVPIGRLPDHESFFAVTVHRAQGSEYDEVVIIPGPADSPVVTRELLYTAITRSRRKVIVYGSPDDIRAAVGRKTKRFSGLRDALVAPGG